MSRVSEVAREGRAGQRRQWSAVGTWRMEHLASGAVSAAATVAVVAAAADSTSDGDWLTWMRRWEESE